MFHAFIIDDDPFIVDTTCMQIPWEELKVNQIEKIYTSDGLTERIIKEKPDIVFIDIELDGKSGLDVLAECHEESSQALFIIISGHNDFHYAHSAVNLGALYYLLKPIDPSDISVVTEKIKQKLNIADDDILNHLTSQKDFENFFSKILEHNNGTYRFLIGELNNPSEQDITTVLGTALLNEYKIGTNKYLFLLRNAETDDALLDALEKTAQKQNITLGISAPFDDTGRVFACFREANTLSYQYFITQSGGLIQPPETDAAAFRLLLDRINTAVDLHSAETLEALFAELPALFVEKGYTIFHVLLLYHSFLNRIMLYNQSIVPYSQMTEDDIQMHFDSFAALCEDLLASQVALSSASDFSNSQVNKDQWVKISLYLEQNYHKKITAPTVANDLFISPATLYNTIKQYTKTTFVKYLTLYRIKKAQELLLQTSLSVLEIGEAVGFKDNFYFNKLFKKQVGLTPLAFRKNHQEVSR